MSSPSVHEKVLALARQHGVSVATNGLDQLALGITNAAGDDIEMDEIQIGIAHLVDEGVIQSKEGLDMLYAYLNEGSGNGF